MDVEYIRGYYGRGENCRRFRMLTLNSIIDQFVHPVGGEGIGNGVGKGMVNTACFQFSLY